VSIGVISDARIRTVSSSFSNLPFTSTSWPLSARWPQALKVSGKTTISMLPVASSSMNTHIRSPLRVFSGRRPDTMPPIEISSAASRFRQSRPLPPPWPLP
jgi:hypothetical protein